MIIFNKLDNYFVVSADSQTFLGFEMTANFRDTSPLKLSSLEAALMKKNETSVLTMTIRSNAVLSVEKQHTTTSFI